MLRISLTRPLPARPRAVTLDELNRVFGGCANLWAACVKDSDCCPRAPDKGFANYGCVSQGAGGTCGSWGYA